MYLEFYGLEQPPFSITPDPHYVFLSEHHRDALSHLLYGIRQGGGGGFVQLTGEVGTGKTTLSRLLLSQLPERTQAALVLNPRLGPVELLQTICEELRVPFAAAAAGSVQIAAHTAPPTASPATQTATADDAPPSPSSAKKTAKRKRAAKSAAAAAASITADAGTKAPAAHTPTADAAPASTTPATAAPAPVAPAPPGIKSLFDALSAYLLRAYADGERVVLIVDEAQNLSAEALEQVRLLTNLETETQKLLQIVLIGQPELRTLLARPELRQVAQRITARFHLPPLDAAGTEAYLRHRLTVAGARRFPFSADAIKRLHRRSGGIPRLINVIAERALLGGFARDLLTVDARTVDRAADEALPPGTSPVHGFAGRWQAGHWAAAAALGLIAAAGLGWALRGPAPSAASTSDASTAVTTTPNPDRATPAPARSAAASGAAPTTPTASAPRRVPKLDAPPIAALAAAAPDGGRDVLRALRRLWSAPVALDRLDPERCPPVPAPGWRCLRARASLDALLRRGRPVLLRTSDARGPGWLLLLGADARNARLMLQGEVFDLDRVALSAVWQGEYLALWPAPAELEAAYAAGDRAALAWVRPRVTVAPADSALPAALRAFQAAHGLRSDGVLGAETLFALASVGPGPRLRETLD